MKKIVSALLTLSLIVSSFTVFASFDSEDDIMGLLSELNIMEGDPDGNFRLDDLVSRAEFTKVAVAASSYKNSVAIGLSISPFKDVPYTHWSAPYVKAAVEGGIVEGYVDATFKPDNTVSYEEAVTMLLRILGYTDEDFGVSWPYGQVGMADSLEMTKNVNANIGDSLTRRQVARLIYNTLDTKMKDSAAGNKLISIFDCEITEGVTIIATNNEDSSLGSDKVFTSAGTFEFEGEFNSDYVGRHGDLAVKNGRDFLSFTPQEQQIETYNVTNVIGSDLVLDGNIYSINDQTTTYYKSQTLTYSQAVEKAETGDTFKLIKNSNDSIEYAMLIDTHSGGMSTNLLDKYVIYSTLGDAVICYKDGRFEQINVKDTTACYKDNVKGTYSTYKSEMEMGDILYVKMDGNEVDYVSYEKGNMEGPIKVTSSSWMNSFDTNSSTAVMRDGNKATASDIQTNDIIYYSSDLNMILAYTTKVTGVYENASPSRDNPTSITLSGKTYTVESVEAFNDLSSSGNFRFGDTITILLGRDGEVAGVVTSNSTNISTVQYGFITETGKKDFTSSDGTTHSGYYVKMVSADGTENEYEVSSNPEKMLCSVSRATFKNGIATLSRISNSSNEISGVVDSSSYTMGSYKLADDIRILDTVGSAYDDVPLYKNVYVQRLDGVKISASSVLYTAKNSAGEISEMILKDVTGDAYTYGVVMKTGDTGMSYTCDIDGTVSTYTSSLVTNKKGPGKFVISGTALDKYVSLNEYNGYIKELTSEYAEIGSNTYRVSDRVVYYVKTELSSQSYMKSTLEEITNGGYNLKAYYDKSESAGGRIRIIVAEKK